MSRGSKMKVIGEFLSESYLPSIDKRKSAQMEFIYNFLLAVRRQTTLGEVQSTGGSSSNVKNRRQSLMQQKEREKQEKQHKEQVDKPETHQKDQEKSPASPDDQDQEKPTGYNEPQVDFMNECELLYRGLHGDLHEDIFHDQTAMIVAYYKCLCSMWDRLHPLESYESDGPTFSLAEFSATQRAFFRGKPREHMNSLKKLLSTSIQDASKDDPGAADKKPWERRLEIHTLFGLQGTEAGHDDHSQEGHEGITNGHHFKQPKNPEDSDDVDVVSTSITANSVPVGASQTTVRRLSNEDIWQVILSKPSTFVQELRRQHFVECLSFFDRLRKALHQVAIKELETKQSKKKNKEEEKDQEDEKEKDDKREDPSLASAQITPKHVLEALRLADHHLTDDQKSIYLVRGFGRRLPDMHGKQTRSSIDHDKGDHFHVSKDLIRKAAALEKGLKLLREYSKEIQEGLSTVAVDTFLRNLGSSGVIKPARLWTPSMSVKEIIEGSGLDQERSKTAGATLEEFYMEHPEENDEAEADTGAVDNQFKEVSEIHEVSVGYPHLSLAHWISH